MNKFEVIKCETGKILFPSRKEAADYIKLYTSSRNKTTNHMKLKPYECHICGEWHMTSQAKNTQKIKKKHYRY